MEFSDAEIKKLEEITTLYATVKKWMLYAEEIHPEKKTFIQPINEIKNAFDHLMRIFASKLELKSADDSYITINLDKAFAHIYRAAYDLLDYISIYLRKKISDEINGISPEALTTIFPEYYKEIKPYVESKSSEISNLRANKDIGDPNTDDLQKYVEIIETIKSLLDKILEIKPSLIDYEVKKKKEVRKSKFLEILIYIAIAIVSGVIGAISYAYF
ncbi:MAG: hypothetical protein WBD09_06820 [Halobacteriota archaeon]